MESFKRLIPRMLVATLLLSGTALSQPVIINYIDPPSGKGWVPLNATVVYMVGPPGWLTIKVDGMTRYNTFVNPGSYSWNLTSLAPGTHSISLTLGTYTTSQNYVVRNYSTVTTSGSPDYHFRLNGSDFFPFGWYDSKEPNQIDSAKSSGSNIVFTYTGGVYYSSYGTGLPYNEAGYVAALKKYLDALDARGMKAFVDLTGVRDNSTRWIGGTGDRWGDFTIAEVSDIVAKVAGHPAVFGWYLFDEPYSHCIMSCGTAPTRSYLKSMDSAVVATEIRVLGAQKHPVFPMVCDPRFFSDYNDGKPIYDSTCGLMNLPPPFDPTGYDAIGWDCYPYSGRMDSIKQGLRPDLGYLDFNMISRYVAKRAMTQLVKYGKWSFIFAGQTQDRYSDKNGNLRTLTEKEVAYSALSPIIQGARGFLYYWWASINTSDLAKARANAYINFFKGNHLDQVIMSGSSVPVLYGNFAINYAYHDRSTYTWQNYNNGEPTQDPSIYGFVQFNSIARRYGNQTYLFAVNDFSSTIQTDFVVRLAGSLVPYRVVQLNVDGTTAQKTFSFDPTLQQVRWTDTFTGYDSRIYRVDADLVPLAKAASVGAAMTAANYPEPFNPTTVIRYSIPKDSYVSVEVYDVMGRKVADLFQGRQSAGSHELTFDGSNVSSGVYFYMVRSDAGWLTKKMLLVK